MSTNRGGAMPQAQLVGLSEISGLEGTGAALLGDKLSLLDSVPVSVNITVGQAHTTVGELMALKEQSLLKIDRRADMPLDVTINGNIVARGQLVVIDDSFGVRITEIAPSAA